MRLAVFTLPQSFSTPTYEAFREGNLVHVVERSSGSPMSGACSREVAITVSGLTAGTYLLRLERAEPTGALTPIAMATTRVEP